MSHGVVMLGAGGRMGRTIVRLLLEGTVEELSLCGALEQTGHSGVGQDSGLMAGSSACSILISDDFAEAAADAAVGIDFSFHESTAVHAAQMAGAPPGSDEVRRQQLSLILGHVLPLAASSARFMGARGRNGGREGRR